MNHAGIRFKHQNTDNAISAVYTKADNLQTE